MDCNQALEYISAALDGELTAEEVAELDAHLADCPECQALAEEFGILSVALSDMEEVPPPGLAEQIKTRLDPAPPVSLNAARRKIRRRAWGSLAAMLAVVVCLGGLYAYLGGPAADTSAAPAAAEAQDPTADLRTAYDSASSAPEPSEPEVSSAPADSGSAAEPETSGGASPSESAAPDTESASPDSVQAPQNTESDKVSGSEEETSAPSSAPQQFVAPPPPAAPSVNAVQEAPEDETAAEADFLAPVEALELVFDYLGGYETYPDAVLPDFTQEQSCQLSVRTEGEQTITSTLVYEGLSGNGRYYTFRLDESRQDTGAESLASTQTQNRFAVSLDGTQILAEIDPDNGVSDSDAFYAAIDS